MCCARLRFGTKQAVSKEHDLVFLYSHDRYMCFMFTAATLIPLTFMFSSFQHNSSTVLLSIYMLCNLPLPPPLHTQLFPILSLENFKSEEQASMLFWNNVIIRENIICTAIFCQFDICCTVTCLRHSIQPSPDCSRTVTNRMYMHTVPHISSTINSSSSQFSCTVYCKH
jgi:hypothetical protein